MFAPNNDITAARAEVYCEEAIYKYEPRVEKISCIANANPDQPNRLDIRIEYVIAGKHEKRNLVYPFYLRTEEDEAAEEAAAKNGTNGTP
jgi:predicted component of type VI protein secretion system